MPLQSLFLLLFFSNNVATRDPWRTYMSCGHASAQKVRKGINYGRKKTFYLFFFETFFLQVKEKKMDYFPRSIYLLPGLLSSQNWPMYENFVTQFVGGRMAQNQFNANIPKLFFLAKFRGRDSKSAQVSVFGRHIFPRSPQPDSR